jgi:rhamnosyltransferase
MATKTAARVGLVIPTLNAGETWQSCLDAIEAQSLKPDRKLVVDSTSADSTAALARQAGFEVRCIARAEFNHGGTRQWAVEYLGDCDIIVFLTQDAILAGAASLAELVGCFDEPSIAVAYGRQLPHRSATPIEAHARIFNYPDRPLRKDISAAPQLGSKTFFCSNSFAAYRRATLVELGGFRRDLILAEDAEYAARAVLAGYANFYCATATAFHSHDYSMLEQLERYFDLGVFDVTNSWMHAEFGSHTGEGLRFIKSEFAYLARNAWWQIPRAVCQLAAKFVGYKLGRWERLLPRSVKRRISMMPRYWL